MHCMKLKKDDDIITKGSFNFQFGPSWRLCQKSKIMSNCWWLVNCSNIFICYDCLYRFFVCAFYNTIELQVHGYIWPRPRQTDIFCQGFHKEISKTRDIDKLSWFINTLKSVAACTNRTMCTLFTLGCPISLM